MITDIEDRIDELAEALQRRHKPTEMLTVKCAASAKHVRSKMPKEGRIVLNYRKDYYGMYFETAKGEIKSLTDYHFVPSPALTAFLNGHTGG